METSHERDLTATRHDPFEIRGFGPIFLPLSCNKANPHHPESRIFPAKCISPVLYRFAYIFRLHSLVKKINQRCKLAVNLSKIYLSDIYIIIIIVVAVFFALPRKEFVRRKRITKRILFSDPFRLTWSA